MKKLIFCLLLWSGPLMGATFSIDGDEDVGDTHCTILPKQVLCEDGVILFDTGCTAHCKDRNAKCTPATFDCESSEVESSDCSCETDSN